MGWINLIVGVCDLHNVAMAYVNFVNSIATYVELIPAKIIITNKTILNQHIIKQGLQIFGQKGKATVRKYLQQFHDLRVVKTKNPHGLTYEERKNSLVYLMFPKLNHY